MKRVMKLNGFELHFKTPFKYLKYSSFYAIWHLLVQSDLQLYHAIL